MKLHTLAKLFKCEQVPSTRCIFYCHTIVIRDNYLNFGSETLRRTTCLKDDYMYLFTFMLESSIKWADWLILYLCIGHARRITETWSLLIVPSSSRWNFTWHSQSHAIKEGIFYNNYCSSDFQTGTLFLLVLDSVVLNLRTMWRLIIYKNWFAISLFNFFLSDIFLVNSKVLGLLVCSFCIISIMI